jgi:hypothetical protein
MALDYPNCGNSQLEKAAEQWAENNGYYVTGGQGGVGPTWGK